MTEEERIKICAIILIDKISFGKHFQIILLLFKILKKTNFHFKLSTTALPVSSTLITLSRDTIPGRSRASFVCVGDSITFPTVEGEKFEKNANMGFGDYPAEYNPKIHGIYDPARFYGKREYRYRRGNPRIFKFFLEFLLSAIMQ